MSAEAISAGTVEIDSGNLIRKIFITASCVGALILGSNILHQCSSPHPIRKGDNMTLLRPDNAVNMGLWDDADEKYQDWHNKGGRDNDGPGQGPVEA